jgi:hypothetical protein
METTLIHIQSFLYLVIVYPIIAMVSSERNCVFIHFMLLYFKIHKREKGGSMSRTVRKKNPKELVLQKYPDAFLEDTGEWVYIRTKIIKDTCPTCKQPWIHKVTDHMNTLGSGGDSEYAWESAAKSLRLI